MNSMPIREIVNTALTGKYDAVIVSGADHVQYLTGAALPSLYSRKDEPILVFWHPDRVACICPTRLAGSLSRLGWRGETRTYIASADPIKAAVRTLMALIVDCLGMEGSVGVDLQRMPAYMMELIQAQLPDINLMGCDDWLRHFRVIKTDAEIELLKDIASRTDHGVSGAIHHVAVLGARTEKYMAEDIRVHCIERGLGVAGYHAVSQAATGPHARMIWALPPRFGIGREKTMKPGEAARMEMRATLDGYWSDAARVLVMNNKPSSEQDTAYQHLVALREAAVKLMIPGARCNEVFRALKEIAALRCADWLEELGAGHGIGVTPFEAPFLNANDDTRLEAGMVLVIDLAVRMASGEILRAKDTVVMTLNGAEVVGWYQDWRQPYTAAYTF